MFPNGQIGRFATQGALFETSVVAKFGFDTAGRPKGTRPPLMRNFRLVIGRGELSRLWSSRGVEEGLRPKYDGGRGRGG